MAWMSIGGVKIHRHSCSRHDSNRGKSITQHLDWRIDDWDDYRWPKSTLTARFELLLESIRVATNDCALSDTSKDNDEFRMKNLKPAVIFLHCIKKQIKIRKTEKKVISILCWTFSNPHLGKLQPEAQPLRVNPSWGVFSQTPRPSKYHWRHAILMTLEPSVKVKMSNSRNWVVIVKLCVHFRICCVSGLGERKTNEKRNEDRSNQSQNKF